jgi:hypothetical protein
MQFKTQMALIYIRLQRIVDDNRINKRITIYVLLAGMDKTTEFTGKSPAKHRGGLITKQN